MRPTNENSVVVLADNYTNFDKERLRADIIELYDKGYRYFYTTLSSDFEYVVAEIIYSLNQFKIDNKYPDLYVIVVIYHFRDYLDTHKTERLKRLATILDSAHNIILTRQIEDTKYICDPHSYCLDNTSLLLTCVNPADMKITCDGDHDLQIDDYPIFVTYNIIEESGGKVINEGIL